MIDLRPLHLAALAATLFALALIAGPAHAARWAGHAAGSRAPMSEHGREPSIDPQPGELGDGMVDVPGGTEIAGGRDTGADAGAGATSGSGPGGRTGMADDDAQDDDDATPPAPDAVSPDTGR